MCELTKVCSKCGECKPVDGFAPRSGALDGRHGVCRDCKRDGHKTWRDLNLDHVRAKGRQTMAVLYAANPEKFRQRTRDRYALDPQACQDIANKWKEANRGRVNEYARNYRKSHLEACAKKAKQWQIAHPSACRAYTQKSVDALSDAYVASILQMPVGKIPKELIEAKRLHLKLKRKIRDISNENT